MKIILDQFRRVKSKQISQLKSGSKNKFMSVLITRYVLPTVAVPSNLISRQGFFSFSRGILNSVPTKRDYKTYVPVGSETTAKTNV
jgi:hypothetical protein